MKIEFKKVRYKNLLSTGDQFTEIDLASYSTTLMCGLNGSGKSSFMDAICFGLYGKPFRKINKPQLVNWVNNRNLLVEIEFSIGQNDYKVIRGQKPNIFELYINDKMMPQDAASKDYQSMLERDILRMGFKTFCQIVIIGSANFTPFMQLTAAQKREFGEDMLDIMYFTSMNSILKERIQNNKDAIDSCNNKIELTETKIDIHRNHQKSTQTTNDKFILEKKDRIKTLQEENDTLSAKIDEIQEKVDEVKKYLTKKQELETKKHKNISSEVEFSTKLSDIRTKIRFFESNEICPTCTQSIEEEFRLKTVEEYKWDATILEDKIEKARANLDKLNTALAALVKYDKAMNSMMNEIMGLTSTITNNLKIINLLEEEMRRVEQPPDAEISIEKFQEELREIEAKKQKLIIERELYNNAAILLKDGGIKSRIIRQYIPMLNRIINKNLEQMGFFCTFDMNENFEEMIRACHVEDYPYESFSEGEKMRINLAILFAWREIAKVRNSAATNLLILDEVMDSSLDSVGMDEFLTIIKEVAQTNNIFIVSHKTDQISDRFDKVLRFVKQKNFSRVA